MMKKILFAFVLSLSLLCAAALAEPCAICGGDRVCDACGGSGYQLMQVYNSDKQVKVACTALCANGACPVCPAPCAVCSSDGLCNTCEGNGYVHMQVYGTNMNVKIACTGENCDDGKCTACKGSISTAIVSTSTPEPSSPFADPVVEKAARASLKTGEKVTADWFEEVKALEIKKHTLSTSTFSDLEKMVNLETLHLIECGITDLNPIVDTLVNLKKLNKLNLLSNQISDLTPLARLKNLVDLAFYKNQVSDLSPLSNLTNLKYLTADYNLISDISPLAKLSKLYSADLNFNQIADVSPLKGLKTLHILSLDNNQIKDISPLRGHPELWSISLKNNQIIDFSALKSMI